MSALIETEQALRANKVAQDAIRKDIDAKYESLRILQQAYVANLDKKYRYGGYVVQDFTEDFIKQISVDSEESIEARHLIQLWVQSFAKGFNFWMLANGANNLPAVSVPLDEANLSSFTSNSWLTVENVGCNLMSKMLDFADKIEFSNKPIIFQFTDRSDDPNQNFYLYLDADPEKWKTHSILSTTDNYYDASRHICQGRLMDSLKRLLRPALP